LSNKLFAYLCYNSKMSSYFEEDENYVGFANQLSSIGLRLKDIPGDG